MMVSVYCSPIVSGNSIGRGIPGGGCMKRASKCLERKCTGQSPREKLSDRKKNLNIYRAFHLVMQPSTDHNRCVRTQQARLGKYQYEIIRRKLPNIYTGPKAVPVPTSQTGKLNACSHEYSEAWCLGIVGNDYPYINAALVHPNEC